MTSPVNLPKPGKWSYMSVPGEFPFVEKTIGELVDEAAEKYGDSEAVYIATNDTRFSFQDVKKQSEQLAAGLLKMGLMPGDRIGIWGPNSMQWYLTSLAASKAGFISVFINPAYKSRELSYSLNKVGMKCIVIAEAFKTSDYYKILSDMIPELKSCQKENVKTGDFPKLKLVVSMEDTPPGPGVFTFPEVLSFGTLPEMQAKLAKITAQIQFDSVCNIQFTSGTTGNPKAVMLSHHNVVNNSFLIGKRLGMTPKDKACLTVPLFHCYGSVIGVLAALHYGVTLVFPSRIFSPPVAVKIAAQEKCTLIYGTPTMHIDMMNIPDFNSYDLTSLRCALTAGSICPVNLIKEMKQKYTVESVVSLYGLTEASPVFFQSLPDDSDEVRAETVGYPQEHTEIKIVDECDRIVPVGVRGEMCFRGYLTMQGYWGEPNMTAEAIDAARWCHTGDLFELTETGHGKVVGRIKDMIIRGGENIYPKELEDFFHSHPSIVEAQVFGVPNERLGEVVAAWLRVKDGDTLTEKDVINFCKGQISHFKIPQYIKFVHEYPKTASGKIQKFIMRENMAAELGLVPDRLSKTIQ